MKKENRNNNFYLFVVFIIFIGIFCWYGGKRSEERKEENYDLGEPDKIELDKDGQMCILEKGNAYYEEIYKEMRMCWTESLIDGKPEFIMWNKFDMMPQHALKIEYKYNTTVEWHMDGSTTIIKANTYTFIPFDTDNGGCAIISENQNYEKQAFVIRYKASNQLKAVIAEILSNLELKS